MITFLSITLMLIGAALIIIPLKEIILKKEKNIHSLTKTGIVILILSSLLVIAGICNYVLLGKQKVKDDQTLRTDLTDSFDNALNRLDSSLKYDSKSGTITTNNFGNTSVSMNGSTGTTFSGNTFNNYPSPKRPEFYSVVDTGKIMAIFKKVADSVKITDRHIYCLFIFQTNGYNYFTDIRRFFNSHNYTLIKPVLVPISSFIKKEEVVNGISVTVYNGKMGIVVGNVY